MILPPHSTDCHLHVLGPYSRFPLAAERAYNVPEAAIADHEALKRRVGLERTVLVQASGHGFDNRAMLAALGELGERARGVAVIRPGTEIAILNEMHNQGVRGVRLNLLTLASRHGGEPKQLIGDYGRLLAPLGWHLQLFASSEKYLELEEPILGCAVQVVIDHMGLPDASAGPGQPGFQAVLRLVRSGRVWVKLAGADRITRASGKLRDAVPYMQALAAAAPQRLVWGSDWPHIGFHSGKQVSGEALMPHRKLDAEALLAVLLEAVPDVETRQAILAGNPATLYGFGR